MSSELKTGNLARYCKGATIDKKTNRPSPSAFELRKHKGEKELSTYLLEYFQKDTEHDGVKAVKHYMETAKKWDFSSPNHGYAIFDVERLNENIKSECGDSCNIVFKPTGTPHYSGYFYGNEITILKLLARSSHAVYYIRDIK